MIMNVIINQLIDEFQVHKLHVMFLKYFVRLIHVTVCCVGFSAIYNHRFHARELSHSTC